MIITEVNIAFIKPKNGLIGFGSLVIDGALYMGNIGIHKIFNAEGHRITYPTKPMGTRQIDVYHPINRTASDAIHKAIIGRLNEILGDN